MSGTFGVVLPPRPARGVSDTAIRRASVGAGEIDRAKRIAWPGTAVSAAYIETVGLLVAIVPWLWIGLLSRDASVLQAGSLYFRIVAPVYAANGALFALSFAAQGSGRMGRVFLAGAIRLLIAAVAQFGTHEAGLFALVALALIAAATVCVVAAHSGALWPPPAPDIRARARTS